MSNIQIPQDKFQKFLAAVLNERKADIVQLLNASGVAVTNSMSDKDVQIAFLKAINDSNTFRSAAADYLSSVAYQAIQPKGSDNFVNQPTIGFVSQPGAGILDFVQENATGAYDFLANGKQQPKKKLGLFDKKMGFVEQPQINFVQQQQLDFVSQGTFLNDIGDDTIDIPVDGSSVDTNLVNADTIDSSSNDTVPAYADTSNSLASITPVTTASPAASIGSAPTTVVLSSGPTPASSSSSSSSLGSFFTPQLLNTALSGALSIFNSTITANANASSQANALTAAQMQLAASHQAVAANAAISFTWAKTAMILGVVAVVGFVVYEVVKKKE